MSLHLLYNIYYVSKADKHKLGKEMLEKKNPIETSQFSSVSHRISFVAIMSPIMHFPIYFIYFNISSF